MGYQRMGMTTGHRKAMLRNMVTSLIKENRIKTTETRAKQINSIAEKMVTLAKKGDLAARRQALAYIYDEEVVKKLFETLGPKYADRQGGYTRIIRTENRRGDAAPMVFVEMV